jgi:ABC-2 type transport system ATP-binding protein
MSKLFGGKVAVNDVSFDVHRGEVFALLGPNGAGKTTTVEVIEGYRRPTSGSVLVLGQDPATAPDHWRRRIGIVLQTSGYFDELTVREVLEHYADIYGVERHAVGAVLEALGLRESERLLCRRLSGGQQRRLDLALGVVGAPQLLFLDEPTTGFDPEARRLAWDLIANLQANGTTVFLTTHFMDEAERLADRIAVIRAGELVALATPTELSEGLSRQAVTIRFRIPPAKSDLSLPSDAGIRIKREGDYISIETSEPTKVLRELINSAGELELPELSVLRRSLEDAYLELVQEVVS